MNRFISFFVCLLMMSMAQLANAQGVVKGKVLDKTTNEPLQFVNAYITQPGSEKIIKGAITDVNGHFTINGLAFGKYQLKVSYVGYKEIVRTFTLSQTHATENYNLLYLSEDTHLMQEVTVVGQRSEMKLEVDRKTFNVDQQISNAGGDALDVLENIPSVEVDNDGNVSLRGNSSVEVWINGRQQGLTSDNRGDILQQLPAESIERIEVIDNPSAKFSAEGSAGIINIVLKKDRKAGYYGSIQAGATTLGGANTSFNINYNSKRFDFYLNTSYRHRSGHGGGMSRQQFLHTNEYQNYDQRQDNIGNNLFNRAGLTWHITQKDDLSLNGMLMHGVRKSWSATPYHYGIIGAAQDTKVMLRDSRSRSLMNMYYGELNYRHNFSDTHFLELVAGLHRWKSDENNYYRDSTEYLLTDDDTEYSYQHMPFDINNRSLELKADYENQLSKSVKLQAGYNGKLSHENTPQQSFNDNTWEGLGATEDKLYFNRFIYDMDIHALYATLTMNFGKFGIMGGMRGEYWKVNTESYTWDQEHDPSKREKPFKKDYFELFPSVFLSYQMTKNDQLQLNYTRRLRRPWGGQLNSFRDTRDATKVRFGNPLLTPEFSNSFSLNYLRTWTEHSLLVSAYWRPTTDVIQRINYQSSTDGLMYETNMNVARSVSTGLELTAKNKLFRILDLSTTANFYYFKLNGFSYDIDGQTVTGESNHNFTWNARMQASLRLPYDISFQSTVRYRAKEVITQGYRKANCSIDMGVRKSFLDKKLILSINCRDLLNSRKWSTYTSSDTFTREQERWRNSRTVRFTLTYNFGNTKSKKKPKRGEGEGGEEMDMQDQYSGGDE